MKDHFALLLDFSRGKGDYFRLGHGTDAHVRKPQLVEALKGKKIVHVSVGALHCLAVTDTGQVGFTVSSNTTQSFPPGRGSLLFSCILQML